MSFCERLTPLNPVDYCLLPLLGALRASGSVPAGLVRAFESVAFFYFSLPWRRKNLSIKVKVRYAMDKGAGTYREDDLILDYLSHDINEEKEKELFAWIAESEANRRYFEQWKEIWESSSVIGEMNNFDSRRGFRKFLMARESIDAYRRRKPRLWGWLPYAAAILAVILSVAGTRIFTVKDIMSDSRMVSINVPAGAKTELSLPDGTAVWLNANSTISYSSGFGFGNSGERIVHLDGEGYFEVTEDKTRPFVVRADEMSVTVLGTKFNVRNYANENDIMLSLKEGSVRLDSGTETVCVQPGERAVLSRASGRITTGKTDNTADIQWKSGIIGFYDETLPDIMKELERQYNVRISISSSSLVNLRFYGTFEKKSHTITDILDMLSSTCKFSYIRDGDSFTLRDID